MTKKSKKLENRATAQAVDLQTFVRFFPYELRRYTTSEHTDINLTNEQRIIMNNLEALFAKGYKYISKNNWYQKGNRAVSKNLLGDKNLPQKI